MLTSACRAFENDRVWDFRRTRSCSRRNLAFTIFLVPDPAASPSRSDIFELRLDRSCAHRHRCCCRLRLSTSPIASIGFDVRLLVITRRFSRARTSRQKIAPLYSDHEACYGSAISPRAEISLRARRRAQLAAHLAMPSFLARDLAPASLLEAARCLTSHLAMIGYSTRVFEHTSCSRRRPSVTSLSIFTAARTTRRAYVRNILRCSLRSLRHAAFRSRPPHDVESAIYRLAVVVVSWTLRSSKPRFTANNSGRFYYDARLCLPLPRERDRRLFLRRSPIPLSRCRSL